MEIQIHIVNGPNLNLLGKRQTEIYGSTSFEEYFELLKANIGIKAKMHYFQSNHEGALIDYLHQFGFCQKTGIVINPGAYTHTSIAIGDAISSINVPVVEVHISDIYQREAFRNVSFLKDNCIETIVGKGLQGYLDGVNILIDRIG